MGSPLWIKKSSRHKCLAFKALAETMEEYDKFSHLQVSHIELTEHGPSLSANDDPYHSSFINFCPFCGVQLRDEIPSDGRGL